MKKPVTSEHYSKRYYQMHEAGFKPMLVKLKPYLKSLKNKKVLDLGCGQGDLAMYMAKKGADVIGIDYSRDAINLANKKLKYKIAGKISFKRTKINNLNFPASSFDLITCIDVFEHISKKELEQVMAKIRKLLRAGGRLVAHTEANPIYLNILHPLYIYPMSQLLIFINKLLTGKNYPGLPRQSRDDLHLTQHINEPTYFYLKKLVAGHGFTGQVFPIQLYKPILSWKDTLYNLIVLLYPLTKVAPLSWLFAYDFIIDAAKE